MRRVVWIGEAAKRRIVEFELVEAVLVKAKLVVFVETVVAEPPPLFADVVVELNVA